MLDEDSAKTTAFTALKGTSLHHGYGLASFENPADPRRFIWWGCQELKSARQAFIRRLPSTFKSVGWAGVYRLLSARLRGPVLFVLPLTPFFAVETAACAARPARS